MTHPGAPTKSRLAVLVLLALILGAACGAWPGAARAAQSQVASTLNNAVSLISDTDRVAPGTPFRIGLLFDLGPGWDIYWTNPGDAGAAPTLALTLPRGGSSGPIAWPIPKVMNDGTVASYGYTHKTAPVLLPVVVTPPQSLRPGAPYTVIAAATWLICKDICVPGEARFTLSLPVGAAPSPSPEAPLFAAVDRRMPAAAAHWPAWIDPDGMLSVDGIGVTRRDVAAAYFFPLQPGLINQDYDQPLKIHHGRVSLQLKPGPAFAASRPLAGLLTLTMADGGELAAMVTARPGSPPPLAPRGSKLGILFAVLTSGGYLALLGGALLGGLILNLMPCVLPVLAMKAAHLAHLSGTDGRSGAARRGGLAYGAGVIVSFAVLGGVLLALRGAGSLAGWGFQFQSPLFVLVMIWLLFAVGLSFSGALEIGGRWTGMGQGLAGRGGAAGSFFTGVLATVVATPCTAPFMGAAVAAALTGPALAGEGIFLALGLGLALPLVAISLIPGIGRLVPRPGRWMDILRQALAFPVYASVLWLVWVASREGGSPLLLAAGGGLLLIALAGWAGRLGGRWAAGLAALALVALVPLLWSARETKPLPAIADQGEPFSTARLAALRAAGKPAFVDLTAAWCVTCLLNERSALDQAAVQAAFRRAGVAYLVGDWTQGNPDITAYLRDNRRAGVPLYVYYPPGGAKPVTLPQILTPAIVLSTIGETSDVASSEGGSSG